MVWGNNIEIFKGQDYADLRRKYMETKSLFQDPLFPPNDHSLNLSKTLYGTVVWKRPTELCDKPQLFVEKASSKDVTQGRLGNCWFVAACASLATVKQLWSEVVPEYKLQEWDELRAEQYAGIFHFRFWRFGKWVDVVIDDLLPTIHGQLIFCHSTASNEFWSALLEKAYAKLCGSYGAMDGGNLCDALVDFTSGLSEMIILREGYEDETKRNQLRKQLLREHGEHALMCCAISTSDSALFESRTKTGLVLGHAYGITAVREINVGNSGLFSLFKEREKITLLRLRNPWGSKEWNGAFSDGGDVVEGEIVEASNSSVVYGSEKSHGTTSSSGYSAVTVSQSKRSSEFAYSPEQLLNINSRSPEWTKISKTEKEKLGLTFEDDGEFWMPFEDFVAEFTDLSICHLINTSLFNFRKTWHENVKESQWTLPNHAGGCPNNDTFLNNPQYCFSVPHDEMELIVQLIQTDTRGKTENARSRTEYKSIGFHVMKVEENRKYRVHRVKKKAVTSDYVKSRSVFFQGSLNKGRHVLVPTTFDPCIETEFLLRMYTEAKVSLKELQKDFPEPMWCCVPFCAPPTCVTCITVEGATGLPKAENTYCIVKSENDSLTSQVVQNSQTPQWWLQGVFFRVDVCKPLTVELWEKRILRDHFLGCATIQSAADNQLVSITSPLVGRGHKQSEQHPGELKLTIVTYDDLNAA